MIIYDKVSIKSYILMLIDYLSIWIFNNFNLHEEL